MNPSLFYLKEIKKYPNSYFKKCKTSTCEPIFSSRKKINTEYDCKKKAFSSRVESPLILRDTLSNLMKDLLIQEAQPKQVNFKIKKNYYEKPFSTQLNQREIIREFQEIEKRASNHVSINELKARIHTSSTGSDELLIKRKDVLLNKIPARFNLKLPKTIDHCRKILAKKEFQGFQTISSQYNQKEMQINFSNFYQTYLKKVKLHKKTVSLQNERKNSKERKEFLQFSEKNKFENEKKSNNSQKPKADQPKTSSTRPSPLEKEENYNLLFTCKSFGPASPYLNLGNLNKQRTQKQFSQNIIQNKKSILENESPEKSQIKIPKENKNQNQNEKDFNDEEDYQIKEDKKVIAEMKTKFRNITNEENRRKGKSNLNLRKALRESLDYFASLKLDLKDLAEKKIFSSKPYEKEGSYDLICHCKAGDKSKVLKLISINKYLVYDFDYVYLTPLHWAVKRGYRDIVQILIEAGSDLNAKDLIGRTPLYLALKKNFLELSQLLLYYKASPWSSLNLNYNLIVSKNPEAKSLLSGARKLNILLNMTPLDQRKTVWEKDAWNLIGKKDLELSFQINNKKE